MLVSSAFIEMVFLNSIISENEEDERESERDGSALDKTHGDPAN